MKLALASTILFFAASNAFASSEMVRFALVSKTLLLDNTHFFFGLTPPTVCDRFPTSNSFPRHLLLRSGGRKSPWCHDH
jgi:hypothetical protein